MSTRGVIIAMEEQEKWEISEEQLRELRALYPDAAVTPEMERRFQSGYSLEDAYRAANYDEVRERAGIARSNERNRTDSVGSLQGLPDGREELTAEEISAMTPRQLAEKLPQVMRSLRAQKKRKEG